MNKLKQTKCKTCDGEGWVCEDHPEQKWGDGDGCCGGAGIPCTCWSMEKRIDKLKHEQIQNDTFNKFGDRRK